jgi:hypothetical protein
MTCPPDIAAVLLQILRTGLLNARAAGWAGDARRCAVEADHVHNLPDLLADYSPERLAFYRQVEAPGFCRQAPASVGRFEELWGRLAEVVDRELPVG